MVVFDEKKALGFLQQNGFSDCKLKKIAGDASFRSYYRVFLPQRSLILMFAPPGHEDMAPFIKIAQFLLKGGFSAPEIYASDFENGFLLLEDFGDNSFSRVLRADPMREEAIYKSAIDCLVKISDVEILDDLGVYNHGVLLNEVMLFVDWYLKFEKNIELNVVQKKQFKRLWLSLFDKLSDQKCLVLRDYHADNLMVLPDDKVGLLDFQDALVGLRAYDLVSLLEDARRDVDVDFQAKMLRYYIDNVNINEEDFLRDYGILSLQRNIKIVGIFARLAYRDGKGNYLDFLPRVKAYIDVRLKAFDDLGGDFEEIAGFIKEFL